MEELVACLREKSRNGLLPFAAQAEAAERFSLSLCQVEEAALRHDILPTRYQRNRDMLSTADQLTLCRSRVAVIGCGGLGGYIIEELARLGVGEIVAVDPDEFEEHNLNRQLLSTMEGLGQKKVAAAADRVARINPMIRLRQVAEPFGRDNGETILAGVTVAADALDTVPDRLLLAEFCRDLDIPLVHGAIGGWFGHLTVQAAGGDTLQRIYGTNKKSRGIEADLGNPSFTPAVVASLQVAEMVKILLNTGDTLAGRYLDLDLLAMEFTELPLK